MGLDMLDLLERWSSEDGEEDTLIEAIVVERTVGEVIVAAVIVGGIVVVKLARESAKGNTAGTPGAFTSVSKVCVERWMLLTFENTSVEGIFVPLLLMGEVMAEVTTSVESAASVVTKAVEARLVLCFLLVTTSIVDISGLLRGKRPGVESSSDFDLHVETTAVVVKDIEEECKGIADMVGAISRGGTAVAPLLGPLPLEIRLWSGSMVISAGEN